MVVKQSEKWPGALRGGTQSPWMALLAYWTPPPSWPRRLLCEGKYFSCSCGRTAWLIAGAILLTYFFIMDIVLFSRFRTVNLVYDSRVGKPDEIYTPITHLSIKAILNDHPSQFLIAPSTEWLEMTTHFSSVFYFITPNMITFSHLICRFIAGTFIASDNLLDRRIGVVLFEYGTWLDAFDGTIHRAQEGLHLQYHSDHSTFGYAIDASFDTLGGVFLCFAILFYLRKRFGSENETLPYCLTYCDPDLSETSTMSNGHSGGRRETWSPGFTLWTAVSVGLCLGVAGKCWDQSVEDFSQVFQTELKDPQLMKLQTELCHSNLTLIIFYLWRIFGGQCVLNYILLSIFMDKIPEFARFTQYVLLGIALVLYIVTALYIVHIRDLLKL